MEVLSSYEYLGLIACSKPNLGAMCLVQIIRCLGATHLRRDPAWLQCIRENSRPTPCDTEGEEDVMQLRVGVGLFSVPCASLPCQVLKGQIAVLVKRGAEIDESPGLRDQGCQDVGSNSVDREDMRETIFSLDSLRLLVADGSIVDDGIECAERIDLLCDLSSLAIVPRSPITTASASGTFLFVSSARAWLRACRTTR